MRRLTILLLILLNVYNIKGQNIEIIVDNVNFVYSLEVENGYLYYSVDDGDGPNGELSDTFVYKLNIVEENSSAQEILTTQLILESVDFLIEGDNMYIAEFLGNRINKINITDDSPTPIIVASNLGNVSSLAISNNQLFYTDPWANEIIAKLDLSETTPTATNIISSGFYPRCIAIKDNELYFSSINYPYPNPSPVGKIYKIDINQQNPTPIEIVSGLRNLYKGTLKFHGDNLYFYNDGKISRVNVTDQSLTVVDLFPVVGFSNMVIDTDYIYITANNQIFKVNLLTLSTSEYELANHIKLTPNPSNNFIQIIGLKTKMKYKIYDSKGSFIIENEISPINTININSLTNGLYFIHFDNGITKKFIKE